MPPPPRVRGLLRLHRLRAPPRASRHTPVSDPPRPAVALGEHGVLVLHGGELRARVFVQDSAGDDSCAGDGDRRDRGLTMRSSFRMPSSDVERRGRRVSSPRRASGRWCRSARVTSSASMSASSRRTPQSRNKGEVRRRCRRALERMAVRLARTRSMTSALKPVLGREGGGRWWGGRVRREILPRGWATDGHDGDR